MHQDSNEPWNLEHLGGDPLDGSGFEDEIIDSDFAEGDD